MSCHKSYKLQYIKDSEIFLADTSGPCTSEVVLRLWKGFLNWSFDRIRQFFDHTYSFSERRLEDACLRALFYDFHSLHVIRSIIMWQLD